MDLELRLDRSVDCGYLYSLFTIVNGLVRRALLRHPWLLLIRSPKFSRDFGFYGFAAEQNGFTNTLILTITPKLFITLTTTLTRNNRIRV